VRLQLKNDRNNVVSNDKLGGLNLNSVDRHLVRPLDEAPVGMHQFAFMTHDAVILLKMYLIGLGHLVSDSLQDNNNEALPHN
jgi:hypothetical protein